MKYIFIAFISLVLLSCSKKLANSDIKALTQNDSSISGKWNVIYDSAFTGFGIANNVVGYTGRAGDYFDFRPDGNVYTKEGTLLDTLSYKLFTDSTIVIAEFGLTFNGKPDTTRIIYFPNHTATFITPVDITPDGEIWRRVQLTR